MTCFSSYAFTDSLTNFHEQAGVRERFWMQPNLVSFFSSGWFLKIIYLFFSFFLGNGNKGACRPGGPGI